MAGGIIFPTIPNPGATPAGMAATVQALMQCVNLLIVNAQSVNPPSHLAGANVFATKNAQGNLTNVRGVDYKELKALQQEVTRLRQAVIALGGQL
jgi:hypothetical protein